MAHSFQSPGRAFRFDEEIVFSKKPRGRPSTPITLVDSEAETVALLAQMATQPSAPHRALIKACIANLKQGGVWIKLDFLNAFSVDTPQSTQEALLDWKSPTRTSSIVGGVTLQAKTGITGDGSTGLVDTGVNPSTAGGNYVQNSATAFARVLTNVALSNGKAICIGVASTRMHISPRSAGGSLSTLLNASSGAVSVANADSRGLFLVKRNSSATIDIRKDKTSLASASAQTSAALSNGTVCFLSDKQGLVFYGVQLAYGGFGSGMSDGESDALYDAMEAYTAGVAAL